MSATRVIRSGGDMKKILYTAPSIEHVLRYHMPCMGRFRDLGFKVYLATGDSSIARRIPIVDEMVLNPGLSGGVVSENAKQMTVEEEGSYDENGALTTGKDGYALVRRTYDSSHQLLRESYYTAAQLPVMSVSKGYASLARSYYESGKVEREAYYDTKNALTIPAKKGYALIVYTYDEKVTALQTELVNLGYLSGTADGDYGAGTSNAVVAFQQDHRLPATGMAGMATQLMIEQAVAGYVDDKLLVHYPAQLTVESKFAAIAGRTDADLSVYMNPSWRFSYDLFEDAGQLDPHIQLGGMSRDGADIDRITLDAALKVMITVDEETDRVLLQPALTVQSSGAYRPYVQGAVIVTEAGLIELTDAVNSGELDGVRLKESAWMPLSDEALQAISEGGISNLRILGRNESFDLEVSAETAKIAEFVSTVSGTGSNG